MKHKHMTEDDRALAVVSSCATQWSIVVVCILRLEVGVRPLRIGPALLKEVFIGGPFLLRGKVIHVHKALLNTHLRDVSSSSAWSVFFT